MKTAECIGGPFDGGMCPIFDWTKLGEVFHLCGGDWPDTTETGARRRLEYTYTTKGLVFKRYE